MLFLRMFHCLNRGEYKLLFLGLLFTISAFLITIIIVWPQPDSSVEKELKLQIGSLLDRIQFAESLNNQRRANLQSLFSSFSQAINILTKESGFLNNSNDENISVLDHEKYSLETIALLKNADWTLDLSLPSIYNYLPHTAHYPNSFSPAFKLSKGRSNVKIVLGIPTVRRDEKSYLETTLQSIFENMSDYEQFECLVIVFIAETDLDHVLSKAAKIKSMFQKYLDSGVLEIISPSPDFYPNMNQLRQTIGDDLERVKWRSKQNLDYAYLMMYAQWRGIYYVPLEDDILTKPNFITSMLDFVTKMSRKSSSSNLTDWFVIDFSPLGFIGKMFKSSNLPSLIQFILIFYNDKPVDWLLENFIATKVCHMDKSEANCRKSRSKVRLRAKPSLFQHIGKYSSLKGKIQKLRDKTFGSLQLFTPHKNPKAEINTSIKHYEPHSLDRAYTGLDFFWGHEPLKGDQILFWLTPPVALTLVQFASGNKENPFDSLLDTSVELLFDEDPSPNEVELQTYPKLEDKFYKIGEFDSEGRVSINLRTDLKVAAVRLNVQKSSEHWIILSEIYLRTL